MKKLVSIAFGLLFAGTVVAADKPNIVIVLLDNTGWGDFGPWGGGELRGAPSPNIDQLAKDGLTLTNFNTEPQCTPSRSALMTGRFAIRSGNQSVPLGVPYYGLIPWEITMAEALKAQGYSTAIYGKWHLGKTPGRFPTDQGFDEWYGIQDSSGDATRFSDRHQDYSIVQDMRDSLPEHAYPYILQAKAGELPVKVKEFSLEAKREIDGELTAMAERYIQSHANDDSPFLLYVPLTAMHFPTEPSREWRGKSGAGMYADMLMQTDFYVGRIYQAIEDAGIADNTLFIFTADNGVEDPVNGNGQYTGWTGPWAGTYFTALEGGLRTPFIATWKNRIPAATRSDGIVHLVDIFSTVLDAAGVKAPQDRLIDGKSMLPFFSGETDKSPREFFPVYVGDDLYALKWRNWKVHFILQETKYAPKQVFSTAPRVVNLLQDPREKRQVAEPYNSWVQYPSARNLVRFEMSQRLQGHIPVGAPDNFIPEPIKAMAQ